MQALICSCARPAIPRPSSPSLAAGRRTVVRAVMVLMPKLLAGAAAAVAERRLQSGLCPEELAPARVHPTSHIPRSIYLHLLAVKPTIGHGTRLAIYGPSSPVPRRRSLP